MTSSWVNVSIGSTWKPFLYIFRNWIWPHLQPEIDRQDMAGQNSWPHKPWFMYLCWRSTLIDQNLWWLQNCPDRKLIKSSSKSFLNETLVEVSHNSYSNNYWEKCTIMPEVRPWSVQPRVVERLRQSCSHSQLQMEAPLCHQWIRKQVLHRNYSKGDALWYLWWRGQHSL